MSEVIHADDEAIVTHICDRIARPAYGRAVPGEPPSRAQVARMLSVAFAASLEKDEQRPVTFSMFYTHELYPINYRFQEAVPLSPRALVRLSSGLDGGKSSIVLTGADALSIAGVWHGALRQVAALTIQVVGAGVFLAKYNAILIATYRRGQFVPYPGTFDTVNDVDALLRKPAAGYAEAEGREAHAAVCRFRILDEMLRIGHGGTLLIVPRDAHWEGFVTAQGFPPKAPESRVVEVEQAAYATWIRRQAAYRSLAEDECPDDRAGKAALLLGGHEIRKHLAAELDALARLTATDGMVLIHPDLTLLGFGVFFSGAEPDCPIEVRDPYEPGPLNVPALAQLGGCSAPVCSDRCSSSSWGARSRRINGWIADRDAPR